MDIVYDEFLIMSITHVPRYVCLVDDLALPLSNQLCEMQQAFFSG